ncbi:hypothetical protein [Mesorhizobium tianshanense]|uniref:hypothetical protein n=1 Tax=Mesorhizobium tianshanense TaxID=39844 RepID=UPI0012DCDCB2|nr:hypothetical protein [Mesorhizobium tianshanense]
MIGAARKGSVETTEGSGDMTCQGSLVNLQVIAWTADSNIRTSLKSCLLGTA